MWINFEQIKAMADEIRELTGDDSQTFLDTLEGETDALEVLQKLILERQSTKAAEEASKQVAADFTARAQRMIQKQAKITETIGKLLDAMGESKVPTPLGTISRTKPRASVSIYEGADIPTQLCKTTVTPDKAAIKKLLENGETVPGAELTYSQPSVTVRVK